MKKILLGLVAASCLTSFALPAFAEDKPAGEGAAAEKPKKAKKAKKEKKADEGKKEEKKAE
jgi:hypothetical protein